MFSSHLLNVKTQTKLRKLANRLSVKRDCQAVYQLHLSDSTDLLLYSKSQCASKNWLTLPSALRKL